jgi:glycosyltransferase involved in cell wall biosynthesis
MKYLSVVNRSFSESPSGSSRVAWDIACLARQHGHDVSLLCTSDKLAPGQSEKSNEEGITVLRMGVQRGLFSNLGGRGYAKAVSLAVKQHFPRTVFDVIHLHSLLISAGVVEALGPRSDYVCTVHSPVVPEQRINWSAQGVMGRVKLALGGLERLRGLQERIFQQAARIHALSEFTKGELLRYHNPGSLKELTVIPHWRRPGFTRSHSKNEARERLKWEREGRVLFSVRRMVPRMGHRVAIEALTPLLERYDCRLVLAGIGPLIGQLQSLAKTLAADGRILFPGRVSEDDLRLMYSAADLFVLPTAALECFGLIIIEALGFGCPVMATNVGAIPEALQPVMPEFLVPPDDVEQLRTKAESFLLGNLISPSEDRILEYVQQRYDVSVVGPRILKFLFGRN